MTPVGVFFICQNEDKCHFVNSTRLRRVLQIDSNNCTVSAIIHM